MKIKDVLTKAENTMLALNRLIVPGARTQGLSLIASFKRDIDTELEKESPKQKVAPKPVAKKTTTKATPKKKNAPTINSRK